MRFGWIGREGSHGCDSHRRGTRWFTGLRPWGIISVGTVWRSMRRPTPIESARRATDSESSHTKLDDLRDFREALRRFEGAGLIPATRVPLPVHLVRVQAR